MAPLLTKQYGDTEHRMRVLETRSVTARSARWSPQMASLLADVRRLESAEDVKVHVEEAMLEALTSVGYQEMGSAGETVRPCLHEPMSGSVGGPGSSPTFTAAGWPATAT